MFLTRSGETLRVSQITESKTFSIQPAFVEIYPANSKGEPIKKLTGAGCVLVVEHEVECTVVGWIDPHTINWNQYRTHYFERLQEQHAARSDPQKLALAQVSVRVMERIVCSFWALSVLLLESACTGRAAEPQVELVVRARSLHRSLTAT